MLVRIATGPTGRANSLGEFGMTSDSNPIVSLSEFTYKRGTEIYGEKESAEYVYQVKSGAVRSYKLLADGRRQIGAFHLADHDVIVARNLLSMTTTSLQHAEDHMLLLGRKTSLERVAAFLIEMDKRLTAAGIMALPMSRRDIADYLGLTLETVSRALSRLHELGILGFIGSTQRQIVLLDRVQLAHLNLQS